MASIEKIGSKWKVRWKEGRRAHSQVCPNKEAARELRVQIERNLALSRPGLTEPALPLSVPEAIEAYLDWSRVVGASRNSLEGRRCALFAFTSWWLERHPRHTMLDLDLPLLDRYAAYLADRPARNSTEPIATRTRQIYITILSIWWKWIAARYPERCHPWRHIDLPASLPAHLPAPTWAEMDGFCRIARPEPIQTLAVILRYTGLRIQQTLALQWQDVLWEKRLLQIRADNEKSRRARTIPLHPELEARLLEIRGIAGSILRLHYADRSLYRMSTRFWKESGAREGITGWHAFRRGVETGLAAVGVDFVRIRKLIGHSLGVDDAYLDAAGLDLREAIERIPNIDWQTPEENLLWCPQGVQKKRHEFIMN